MPRFSLSPLVALVIGLAPLTHGAGAPPEAGRSFTMAEPAIAMVWITPGSFEMRSVHGAGDDTQVTLTRGYWLGRTEITQAQWQTVARHLPIYANIPLPSYFRGSDRPVEQVTWEMAALFCARINEVERAAGRVPPGYEYRLPTEAEWEYACRAGTTAHHAGKPDEIGWHDRNSGQSTHPVGQKKPNAWGLYDMHGNVGEWCNDWYAPYPGGQVQDPAGPQNGIYRVHRGAGATSTTGSSSALRRVYAKPSIGSKFVGLRLALGPAVPPSR